MPIYESYAPFYDGSGQIRFAVLIHQYISELLLRHPVDGRHALDLACGSGTLAWLLAEAGWQVMGLDQSKAMLALARSKVANLAANRRPLFIQGDMRDLIACLRLHIEDGGKALEHLIPFNLITCTYDSLNYMLTSDDLRDCFNGVAQVLAPGGLFIADMNTHYFLEHDWGTCEVIEHPGYIQVTQSHFDPESACSTMVLSGFVGDDDQGYVRFDEVHVERAYEIPVITELLEQVGLRAEAVYDCFTFQQPYEQSQRIAWVIRRHRYL